MTLARLSYLLTVLLMLAFLLGGLLIASAFEEYQRAYMQANEEAAIVSQRADLMK